MASTLKSKLNGPQRWAGVCVFGLAVLAGCQSAPAPRVQAKAAAGSAAFMERLAQAKADAQRGDRSAANAILADYNAGRLAPGDQAVMAAEMVISKEQATKGNLGALRVSVMNFHLDNSGTYPVDLHGKNFQPIYMDAIPPEQITGSNRISAVHDGKGGWLYDPKTGDVRVNLDGHDSRGVEYFSYGHR